jgi:valyl-tRNA synthetase
VIELIGLIRSSRTALSVPPSAKLELYALRIDEDVWPAFSFNQQGIRRLARLDRTWVDRRTYAGDTTPAADIAISERELEMAPGSMAIGMRGLSAYLPLADHMDLEAEKVRLSKSLAAAEKERDSLAARLANPNFTERAKPEAVEKARADHEAKSAEAERLRAALDRLG